MENKELKMNDLQKKSHEILLKLLNNIGVVGSIILSVSDLILVIIFVIGIEINITTISNIIFSLLNSFVGVLINCLLRYQGKKYAEIENKELCDKFYRKKIKENKKFLSMNSWLLLSTVKDILIKGILFSFIISGSIYISIDGSKNPIQILITIVTILCFVCFGLVSMNSSYCRFYNIQVPYMELKIKEKGENQNVDI